MNVKECYEMLGGDYDEIMRLMISEERVIKYLLKFKEDHCMLDLTTALNDKRYDEAFRFAHTLKGVSINLMMKRLEASCSALTEALRAKQTEVEQLYNQVKSDYELTIQAIDCLINN